MAQLQQNIIKAEDLEKLRKTAEITMLNPSDNIASSVEIINTNFTNLRNAVVARGNDNVPVYISDLKKKVDMLEGQIASLLEKLKDEPEQPEVSID